MTNIQIITKEVIINKIMTKEEIEKVKTIPVHTYQYWKELGYQVRKGEKAAIKTKLWKQITVKTEDGGSAQKLILAAAALFTWKQVDKIEAETSAPKKKTASAQKKTSSAKTKKALTKQEAAENLKKIEDTPVKLVTSPIVTGGIDLKEVEEMPTSEQIHGLDEIKFTWNHGTVKGTWDFHMGGMFPMGQKNFKTILSDMITAPNSAEVVETARRYLHNEKVYYADSYNKGKMKMLEGNLKQICAIA